MGEAGVGAGWARLAVLLLLPKRDAKGFEMRDVELGGPDDPEMTRLAGRGGRGGLIGSGDVVRGGMGREGV